MTKLKILSVTSLWPYPPDDATRNRSWNLISRLGRTEDVTLLTWIDEPLDPSLVEPVEAVVSRVVTNQRAPANLSLTAKLRRRVRSQRVKMPAYVIERIERQASPTLHDLGGPFDVVVAEDDSAFYLVPDLGAPVVVHRHNIFTDTIETLIRSGNIGLLHKLELLAELGVWRSYDRSLSASADLNLVTTPEAKQRLEEILPSARVEVVRNGVNMPEHVHDPVKGHKVVFIGGMSYEPNVNAVIWFAERVWPLVLQRLPDARFDVIGRAPVARLHELSAPGVTIVGEVQDMFEACRGARMGVVPLRAGSGVKTKTLELMAMGLPVVATPQGMEGFEGLGGGYIVTEDPAEMADKVVELSQDGELAKRLGEKARETARMFSWDEPAEKLRNVLHELVASSGRGEA